MTAHSNSELHAEALELLQKLTGNPHAVFHQGQFEAIEALVADRRRALVIQRTGWGKSAVYFIAALLMRRRGAGPALIVSPLLALMRDQVQAAERAGVRAEMVNSSNVTDWDRVQQGLNNNEIDVLLVGPERLNNPRFITDWMPRIVSSMGLLVVDEAHCISDWGHDFRPDYRRIRNLIAELPASVPVLATTATANERVVEDVAEQLGVHAAGERAAAASSSEERRAEQVFILRGPLSRSSLRLGVLSLQHSQQRVAWLIEHLNSFKGSGIIYALTVSAAEDTAATLRQAGFDVLAYTGKTDPEERLEAETALKENRVKALVATSALGMGFDKPDLGFVVHLGAPSSAVAYYQQVGRAGRGAIDADVLLMPGSEDREIWEYFATASMPTRENTGQLLAALEEATAGGQALSVPALEPRVDVRRNSIELLLKVLAVEGAVQRVDGGWVSTGAPWTYDAQRYERVAAARLKEQDEMLAYEATSTCRMVFLAQGLDDMTAQPCGICDNCAGPWYPADFSEQAAQLAGQNLHRAGVPIEPRRQWPSGLDQLGIEGVRGNIKPALRAEEGRALARLSDLGWGNRLREIFAPDAQGNPQDGAVPADLGRACVRVLGEWEWSQRPAAVVSLPSPVRPQLVDSLARGLAQVGQLHDLGAVNLVADPAHYGGNSVFRCAGVYRAFELTDSIKQYLAQSPVPVLLVSEEVDSRWSFTVVAQQLRQAGASAVLPFALAANH
ncbi:RecQ family ATP-dependent DNA helicase [Rothia aerolata]|uniref:DNA 3'-5' helicase n=1 Tax=Rothia aerolata TaxID=1812262 RepID=A0A917IUH9_9MICC|nr:RecQ family ATP-dependent DNA helicase [Rothia aerolata]GGH64850.1 ATP-dependent DNA helicase RecQ [Rothia aerolata]